MKKLVFLSVLGLFFTNTSYVLADDSGISDEDFFQLTCGYLLDEETYETKREAITEVLAATQSVINSEQKQDLKDLLKGEITVDDYCYDIEV